MSSSEKTPPPMPDPETRKGSNSSPAPAPAPAPTPTQRGSGSSPAQQSEVQEMKPLKCPRCDSSNTKFCYYNNYSLRQPRHFCKTCRRYWTHGGSLRNVPIGGASRKPKNNLKLKPKSSPSSSGSHPDPAHHHLIGAGSCTAITTTTTTTTTSCGDHIHVAIESLSSINQEMHWKLQHQRLLSLIYDHHDQLDNNQNDKLLQKQLGEVGPTEWFIDQTTSYVPGSYSSVTDSTEVEAADNPDGWNYFHHQFNGFR